MRKILLMLLGVLALSTHLLAQNRTITGRILDAQNNGIPNASVSVKGTTVGTVTGPDGGYSISVPPTAKSLVVSSVGMTEQELPIGNRTVLNATLITSDKALQEVVVTGYARERRSQFAGAASIISGRSVETVPVGSFDQALQGRAPGLLVNSGSGQPGSSAQVTIRGVQSIQGAGAQPLYVLDGVPLPSFDMQTINPNDFESITVLKDANAAAIYGARGGTGVIVITTKKGRTGTTNFTVRSQAGFTQRPDFSRLNLMNTAEILEYEERMGLAGAATNTPGWVYSKRNPTYATLPASTQARYNTILDSIRGINTNYADIFYRKGFSQTHEVNMSGGTDKTRFYLSAGLFDQEGIDLGSSLKRYTTRINIDHTVNRLTVQLNSTAGFSKTNLSEGEWLGNSARSPFQMTYRAKPYENPYKTDGSLNFGPNTTLALTQVANLMEGIENSYYRQNQIKVNAGLTIGYKIIPSVTLKNTFGIDAASDLFQHFINANSYYGSLQTFQSGENRESYRLSSQLINTSSAIFSQKFNDIHEVEAGAYFEVVRGNQKGLGFTQYNLDPRLEGSGQGAGTLPTNGAANYPQNVSSARSGFGIRSYFATGRYTYNNKYSINANVRRDGTSRIVNPLNREITTWSAGAIWNAMQETFLRNQNIFSDVRVRASYGIVPNIGSIATSTYGIGGGIFNITNYQGPQIPSFGSTTYAGSGVTGLAPTSPGNPNLQIEKIKKANVGVDFAIFRNRARFTVDAYQNKTVDLFVRQPLSGTTGFANLDINAGVMTNKGIEFTTNVDIIRQKDFSFMVGLNHSINKNNIEDLGAVNEYFLGTFIIKEGLPYGTHYTTHYLGADPATGQPRFETEDGKETFDVAKAGNFYNFGTYLPKHVGGFNTELRFKGFSLDALFSYQFDV
ncbi:MAG TPA: SusC/RagA family TonB-linked outer membrane protein, partial [Chitinophagaceae bacterium]|nr:SusC/RagA family TonB-linked outer membrane protein [Chitinophagaceae bacterium]